MKEHNPTPAMKLSRAALAFRSAHAAIAIEQLLAIAYVWWCALTGRDRLLHIAAASLIGEGVLVTANRGDCPLERVMNLGENRIGMRIHRLAWCPAVPRFPHSQAIPDRVHNSL
jgi:hypothetical protein